MRCLTAFALIIVAAVLLLADVDARGGRGGGGRGGGSRAGRSGRTSRTSGKSRSSGPRITKTTPIKPTTFRSPVIKSQTKSGSRTKLFTKVVASYVVIKYGLSQAPVYRGGFPLHGSYVSIPQNRAVRLSSESERLLNSNGSLCLGQSHMNVSLKEGIENYIIELNTTVNYNDSPQDDEALFGVNNTVSLEDIKEKNFAVITRARYNVTVVENTTCTQVERQINGTMIQLYEFNPNTAKLPDLNFMLIFTSIMITGIFNSCNKA